MPVMAKMKRQLTGDIPDMNIYYDRYELGVGVAEVGKDETDTTKLLNDSRKLSIVMNCMLLNLAKHCLVQQIAVDGMVMSGLAIKFSQLVNPRGYVCAVSKKEEFCYSVHSKECIKKWVHY